MVYFMELKEAYCFKLIGDKPVEPRLSNNTGPYIDMEWVLGNTCSEVFDLLSFQDRWILFLVYHDEDTGLSSSTLKRVLKVIKEKLGAFRESRLW